MGCHDATPTLGHEVFGRWGSPASAHYPSKAIGMAVNIPRSRMQAKYPMNIGDITSSTIEWERGISGIPRQHPAQPKSTWTMRHNPGHLQWKDDAEMMLEPENWKATASWLLMCQPAPGLGFMQEYPHSHAALCLSISLALTLSGCNGYLSNGFIFSLFGIDGHILHDRWVDRQKDGFPNKMETFPPQIQYHSVT